MADGFAVDRAALAETAKGLAGIVDQLKKLGFSESAEVGLGFSDLALSEAQAGSIVGGALAKFCDQWNWGVSTLVQDGYQFGERLGLTVGLYNDVENQTIGAIKDLVASGVGDPWMTSDQASAASWNQDMAAVDGAQTPGGKTTEKQALQEEGKQWEGVASNVPGLKEFNGLVTKEAGTGK